MVDLSLETMNPFPVSASSSLVSQEGFVSQTPMESSTNEPTDESNGSDIDTMPECIPAAPTTPPTFFVLYWTFLYSFISSSFQKVAGRLHSLSSPTDHQVFMPQSTALSTDNADSNSNANKDENVDTSHSSTPLRRSPRLKPKRHGQQTPSASGSPAHRTSSVRSRSRARQGHQTPTSLTPAFSSLMKTKTLVLDLDETLIHSTSRGSRANAHVIEVMVDKHAVLYYVYKRPHVDEFLQKVSEWYKVVVFTASMPEYADPVIDYLDPNRILVSKRFFRQSCINRHGAYVKDLTIVEPDLSRVFLVDNSPVSYALHQENGIPIEGWMSDPHDEALLDLLPFLDALRFTEDVRSVLSLASL